MLAVIRSRKIAADNLWEVSTTARALGSDLRQVSRVLRRPARHVLLPADPCLRRAWVTNGTSRPRPIPAEWSHEKHGRPAADCTLETA
jgi:hypothetical protein